MADKQASYAIVIEDEASGAANSAAQALRRLDDEISENTKALAGMNKAMRDLKSVAKPNETEIKKLQDRIDAQKSVIGKAQEKYIGLGGSFVKAGKPIPRLKSQLQVFGEQLKSLPGPLGGLVGKLELLTNTLGGKSLLVVAGMTAALTALGVVLARVGKSLLDYAVAQADAARSEMLHFQGLTKLRTLFARAPGDAKAMIAAIDDISQRTPTARSELVKWGEQLHRMGVRGKDFGTILEGVSLKLAVHGSEQANMFAGHAAGLSIMGRSVDAYADRVKSKLGGIAQAKMQSLTVQTLKQKEAQELLFAGLDVEAYTSAWSKVTGMMNQQTESGKALALLVKSIFQPMIDLSTKAAPLVERLFLYGIVGALKFEIAIVRVRNWLRKTFGDPALTLALEIGLAAVGTVAILAGVSLARLALQLTAKLVPAMARATWQALTFGLRGLGSLAAGAWGAAIALWAATAPLLPFVAAAIGAGLAIYTLIKYWDDLVLAFRQVDWSQLGRDIIDGIKQFLDPSFLIQAMESLATSGLNAFKSALGISSPSKEFMRVGLEIPRGLVAGVEQGSPEAEQASRDMVDASAPKLGQPPSAGVEQAASAGARGAAARGATTITIGEVVINATTDKPEQLAVDFRRELERVLAGFALELGAAEATP